MVTIEAVRCILLSSPYSFADDVEIRECFPNGPKRTVGMVEVTLSNGVTGIGEGYLAVFAPLVFKAIIDLCTPPLIGKDAFDIARRSADLRSLCDYWSLQGAARHAIAAVDIALHDAAAKSMGMPLFAYLGGSQRSEIKVYGSGGCCDTREHFLDEFDQLEALGITLYKIRAVQEDINRSIWVLEEARRRGIRVGVDMCQNLADPPQAVDDVVRYLDRVHTRTGARIEFVEEAIGPDSPEGFRELRNRIDIQVCGGEIITTPKEMIRRMQEGVYDFVQPDASVIGGIGPVMEVFAASDSLGVDVVTHAWGGAAAIMANYHAAFAGGGRLVEHPMLDFPLGDEMLADQRLISGGRLRLPDAPGIGVTLTPDMEARYPFDPSAVYSCILQDFIRNPDDHWL
ncbi:MAG: mandelate racemase/muconate lactonizing enzyme family protein [Paracoccaceae bacterium]|nr:mandelate racemase/muconate lactonizing enzyme family protein [Paracoccaceae bacterium]MDE2913143.1 mandelate racemase/muconate lactonizing enzyme family protein [Paracoccaceae bacterium]